MGRCISYLTDNEDVWRDSAKLLPSTRIYDPNKRQPVPGSIIQILELVLRLVRAFSRRSDAHSDTGNRRMRGSEHSPGERQQPP